jgi:hypothetical protein
MKRRRLCFLAWLLCLAALGAACQRPGAGGGLVASSLITKADAERILGQPVRLESEKNSEKESMCLYVEARDGGPASLQATFQVAEDEEQVRAADELARKFYEKKGRVETVEGIGDGAWLVQEDSSTTLHVRKQKTAFLINALKGEQPASLDAMKEVARRVAARL